MERILETAKKAGFRQIDLTGGAPELHPEFKDFVKALRGDGHLVQVRTNLTVLLEPGLETLAEFFREYRIHLVASIFVLFVFS